MPPADYLRWKLEAPGPLPARAHLLAVDGELAAFGLYLPRGYRLFGTSYPASDGVDAAVHPDHQGRGLYSRRRALKTEFVDQDFAFNLSFSLNERVRAYRRNRGRGDAGGMPRILRRFNHPRRAVATESRPRWQRLPALLAIAAFRGWSRLRDRPLRFEQRWQLVPVERFDARVGPLFERAASQFDFVQERDERLLNWRYADPRNAMYSIVQAEQDGELLGYVVYRRTGSRGFVLDLLARPGRNDVVASLLERAVGDLEDCDLVECWVTPGHPYEAVVRGLRFTGPVGSAGSAARPISIDPDLLAPLDTASGRAHVMLGDSDWM